MTMEHPIRGLHHVTATVSGAQEDLDFATGVLGLRLIKQTVNFDNHSVYHFYYGDERGTPGSVWTTFPYKDRGVPVGTKGVGQITATSFSVPADSIDGWEKHLRKHDLAVNRQPARFGEQSVVVTDPSGLNIELVGTEGDRRAPWVGGEVSPELAIRGLHSVTLQSRAPDLTRELMVELLGFSQLKEADRRMRMGIGSGEAGKLVDIIDAPSAPLAKNGLGTVHHVAFAVDSEEEQLRLRQELIGQGLTVTEVLDRSYFRSIYFREPGGILFEVATTKPGFTIDEDLSELGTSLKLPEWEESNRREIEATLPQLSLP
jgi:glyoxalase family protein